MWILQIGQKGSNLADLVNLFTDELCLNLSKGSPQQGYSQTSDPWKTPVQQVVVPSDICAAPYGGLGDPGSVGCLQYQTPGARLLDDIDCLAQFRDGADEGAVV